jgi:ABC-type multidrug transport system fused ATPase/permease subunit
LVLEFIAVSALGVLVVIMLKQGKTAESIMPTVGLFAAAAFRMMPSANRIFSSSQSLRYALPVLQNLYSETVLLNQFQHGRGHIVPLRFFGQIQLNAVSYCYPGEKDPSISDISLTINRGDSIGFIGGSGAGKSTLVNIILGLLTPSKGRILVRGQDIQVSLRDWRSIVGYVPQSIFLTDDTLRRNIAFGLPEDQIDDAAIERAVHAAQLEAFIDNLSNGLDTFVGERGARLSGGQLQRIGIARALYHDPQVLVLDEATSALDNATEKGVMEAIRALRGDKTILIVAHRLSTVVDCDFLYRLEHGTIIDAGATEVILNRQSSNRTRVD